MNRSYIVWTSYIPVTPHTNNRHAFKFVWFWKWNIGLVGSETPPWMNDKWMNYKYNLVSTKSSQITAQLETIQFWFTEKLERHIIIKIWSLLFITFFFYSFGVEFQRMCFINMIYAGMFIDNLLANAQNFLAFERCEIEYNLGVTSIYV